MLFLQRTAGNAAVSRAVTEREPSVFGMDKDDFVGSLWEDVKSGAVERRIYAYFEGMADAGVGLVEGFRMLLTDPAKVFESIGRLPETAKVFWKDRDRLWAQVAQASDQDQARLIGSWSW